MCRTIQITLVLAAMLLVPAESSAQINQLEKLYGQGVHAWNSGLTDHAISAFDRAIEMGSRDPRVWYYRGVVRSSLGNRDQALSDFHTGAELEASATGRFFAVGRSLERVQGSVRIEIETARQQAKLAAQKELAAAEQQAAEDGTLPVIPDGPTGRAATQPNLPDTSGGDYPNTPFADMPTPLDSPPRVPVDTAEPVPAPAETADPVTDPAADPVEDPAPMDDPPADDDPFGSDDDPPMDESDDDPFGDDDSADDDGADDDGADDDNPFGDDDSGSDDGGSDDGGDEDDPFGDGQ